MKAPLRFLLVVVIALLGWWVVARALHEPASVAAPVGDIASAPVVAADDDDDDAATSARVAVPTPVVPAQLAETTVLVVWQDTHDEVEVEQLACQAMPGAAVEARRLGPGRFALATPEAWRSLGFVLHGNAFGELQQVFGRDTLGADGQLTIQVARSVNFSVRLLREGAVEGPEGVDVGLYEVVAKGTSKLRLELVAKSEAGGVAHFANLSTGRYRVRVAGNGWRLVGPALIAADVANAIVDVWVASEQDWNVSGRVVSAASGVGVAGVALLSRFSFVATSDEHGYFVVPGSARSTGPSDSLRLRAQPGDASGYSATMMCGPFAWGESGVTIELLPARNVLEVVDVRGAAAAQSVSYKLPSGGPAQTVPQWSVLRALGGGRFLCPKDLVESSAALLRDDAAGPGNGVRFAAWASFDVASDEGATLHRWVRQDVKSHLVQVLDQSGRPLLGANIEAIQSLGPSFPLTAQALPDIDPSQVNPFVTGNQVQLLAEGFTGVDGTCPMYFSTGEQVHVRAHYPGCLDAIAEANATGTTRLTLRACGQIRGTILGYRGGSLSLIGSRGVHYPSASVHDGEFFVDKVPVGDAYVVIGNDRFPIVLGTVTVTAGDLTTFTATDRDLAWLPATLHGPDLRLNDELRFYDDLLDRFVHAEDITRSGELKVSLPPGAYRVVRRRKEPGYGSGDIDVVADQVLRVRSDTKVFELSFPDGPLRFRVLDGGAPVAHAWLQAEDLTQIARSDADGWVRFAFTPARTFRCVEVGLRRSGWRPTGRRWSVAATDTGRELETEN